MNVIELSMVAAPVAGGMAGARAMHGHGLGMQLAGAGLGLVVGALAFGAPALLAVASTGRGTPRGTAILRGLEWLGGMLAVLSWAASPILAWLASGWLVPRLLTEWRT